MFSMRLKALRETKEISQLTLATFLHYSQQSIAKWESGDSTPPADVLAHVANYFNVSVDYLLGQDLLIGETTSEYATAKDLAMRMIRQPVIAQYAGYSLEHLSESDLSLFADDILAMLLIAAKRFDT